MNKPPDPSPPSIPISFFPCLCTVQGSESVPTPYCLFCPLKLQWKISMPSLARGCPIYFSLNSFCFVRSEDNSACSILDCSTSERCPTFVKPQWLVRILTVLPLMRSPTFVADFIAHLGSVGVAIRPLIVVLQVDDSRYCRFEGLVAEGGLVALLLHLQRGSYLVTVHKLPEWPLLTVSTHFRLLVFRSEFKVCFLTLYPSPLRVICCHSFYLMDSNLKSTMNQFGSRFISGKVLLYPCWILIKQNYYLDKICQVLRQLCDVMPVVIRMATLLALNPINVCFALQLDMDVFTSFRGFRNELFGLYNRCSNAYSPCCGIIFRSIHLDTLERVSSFGRLWQFILLVLTCSCIVRSLVPATRFEILLTWIPPSLLLSLGSLVVFYLLCLIPSLLSLLLSSLVLLLIWFCFYVVKPLKFGLQFSQWADHVYLGFILVVCSSTPFVQSSSLRTSCVTYKVQHGSMCSLYRRYIGMVGHSSEGGWFLLIMMILNSSFTAMWVKHILSWGLPSLWLSLFMVSPYAQMLGTLCSSICWHLASLLHDWDEVKGQYPLVYEDVITETSLFDLRTRTIDTFRLVWYSDAGIPISHCLHDQWPASSIEAYGRVFETRNSLMVKGPLMLIFLLRMYCFHMNVLERIKCIKDDTVSFPSGCISSLAVSCTRFFVSDFE